MIYMYKDILNPSYIIPFALAFGLFPIFCLVRLCCYELLMLVAHTRKFSSNGLKPNRSCW